MFATARQDLVVAGWRRKKEKSEKKAKNIKTSRPTDGMPNKYHE